jgi:phosphonate transport system substrate-binding protein
MAASRGASHGARVVRPEDRQRDRCYPIGPWTGRLAAVALAVLCLGGTPAQAAEKLDMGTISESPTKMIKRFAPLQNYLQSKGLPMGSIVNAPSVDRMIDLIKEGRVDFVTESPYGAARIMDATGAAPILIQEKDGVKRYNSVIFVDSNSGIEDLDDLKGKTVVFEDPESTSSYMLPRQLLSNAGLELVESTEPVPGKVAYYFSGGDENVLAHVKLGRADAGGIDRTAVVGEPSRFRILSPESRYVPRYVLLVRDGVGHQDLEEVLLKMAADPDAADTLKNMEAPTGFSRFEGDPRRIMNEVKAALGL